MAAALLVGLYVSATFEQTAIETVPTPEGVAPVFVPFTPTPPPTAAPTEQPVEGAVPTTWQDGIADLLNERCGSCHAGGGAIAGLDVSSLDSLLEGGASGPAVVLGQPEESLLIQRQVTGDHPGQLTGAELESVRDWIEAGAPSQ